MYVKVRLEVIGKGASDCDGYTSNTEEATFIVSNSHSFNRTLGHTVE